MPVLHLALLCMTTSIKTVADFNALAMRTYVYAALVAVVALGIAALWSNSIAWEPGANATDRRKRRVVFWSLLVTAAAGFAMYNTLGVGPCLSRNLATRFMRLSAISAVEVVVLYAGIGYALSKTFASGKLGDWFHKAG